MKITGWGALAVTAVAFTIPVVVFCAPGGTGHPPATPHDKLPKPLSQAIDIKLPKDVKYSRYIVVDQFGYQPDMTKVAILANPERGWNSADVYEAGTQLELRRSSDGRIVYEGRSQAWKGGELDEASGDRGAWFDFSEFREPGTYFVYDPRADERSDEFSISPGVYEPILKAALRVFYFNRANYAKKAPYACVSGKCWEQGVDYLGPGQDSEARSVRARNDATTARDLSGGFWDAGDVNKYVTFAYAPVHQLLSAFEDNPSAFGDNLDIPESSNGVPDILDLVWVELELLQKMQAKDLKGGVLLKMGSVEYGDPLPEASKLRRFYYPGSCSSAVISVASVFAHAALIFDHVPGYEGKARELRERAKRAFDHYQKSPRSDACDDGTIHAGDADVPLAEQEQRALSAAVYLLEATGDEASYLGTIQKHARDSRLFKEDRLGVYDAPIFDALLRYAQKRGSSDNLASEILARVKFIGETSDVATFSADRSLYRVYQRRDSYHWGSNQARANFGNSAVSVSRLPSVADALRSQARSRAADLLHYFHGQNPLQLVMLSNMSLYGATRSISEIYHAWFRDGDPTFDSATTSRLGPAPGFVVGGVNPGYCSGEADHRCFASDFSHQPVEKAYVDSNTGFEPLADFDMTWALSEPAIYYQAAYVKLLANFAHR